MAEADRNEVLASQLLEGVAAMRDGRARDAIASLTAVASDPELAAADDLRDLRARACSLLGQALLAEGRIDDAAHWVDQSMELLRALSDRAGLDQVRTLHAEVVEARNQAATRAQAAARSARLADVPLEEIVERVADRAALADVLVRKANAEIDAGRSDSGHAIARDALDLARELSDIRTTVLAQLSIARAHPPDAERALTEAWSTAERANEFNLVGAVARAAQLAGVQLPVQMGPLLDEPE